MERRLAAVLAIDMVGYSRLMGVDERGTLAAHRRHRRELFNPRAPSITAASSSSPATAR